MFQIPPKYLNIHNCLKLWNSLAYYKIINIFNTFKNEKKVISVFWVSKRFKTIFCMLRNYAWFILKIHKAYVESETYKRVESLLFALFCFSIKEKQQSFPQTGLYSINIHFHVIILFCKCILCKRFSTTMKVYEVIIRFMILLNRIYLENVTIL